MVVHGDQIYVDFVKFLIHKDLYAWCLRYNICSARFLDIRILTYLIDIAIPGCVFMRLFPL